MSDEGSEQDRSEQPTPFKLDRARRKGTVARGLDLGFLTGLAAFSGYMWMLGEGVAAQLGLGARRALVAATQTSEAPNAILFVVGSVLSTAARPIGFLIGAVFLTVLVFELVQTGPVFSTEPLRPDFSRLNPAKGLKRVFSVRMLIETGKSILKLAAYAALAWLAVTGALKVVAPTVVDAAGLERGLRAAGLKLLALFLGGALIFAVLDQLIVRREYLKKMRMSRREVKRESRDREGDPRLKSKRKQLHREFVKASESVRNIRGADVLVTNPTHYAVALRYDPRRMDAPVVVSRGAQHLALRLRRLAFSYGVVIVQNPALARALYRCELNRPVPETLFRPVADLYKAMRAAQRRAGETTHA